MSKINNKHKDLNKELNKELTKEVERLEKAMINNDRILKEMLAKKLKGIATPNDNN